MEAGVEAGIELGERSLLKNQIRKKLEKGKSIEQIADELEEEVTTIQRIIEEIKKKNKYMIRKAVASAIVFFYDSELFTLKFKK